MKNLFYNISNYNADIHHLNQWIPITMSIDEIKIAFHYAS